MNKLPIQLPFFIRFWWLFELITFLIVGYFVGYGWAFLAIVLGSLLGLLLIKGQASAIMKQMKTEPMSGAFMMMNTINSSFIFLSGFFFLIPGFLTDIIAIICLLPAVRKKMINKVMMAGMKGFGGQQQAANDTAKPKNNTIEGEFWKENNKDKD